MRLELNRDFVTEDQCLGILYIIDECEQIVYKFDTIERGWLDNKKRISCIPEGTYPIVLEYSNRFKQELWELKEVPNRSECKIHAANYSRQLNGCIALGNGRADIDKDGLLDVIKSRKSMKLFHELMAGITETNIKIVNLTNICT